MNGKRGKRRSGDFRAISAGCAVNNGMTVTVMVECYRLNFVFASNSTMLLLLILLQKGNVKHYEKRKV